MANENTVTGKEIFPQLSVIELVLFSTKKQRFQWGNNRNEAGKVLNLKLSGEANFLGVSSFCCGGAPFQRGRNGGCCYSFERKGSLQ